MRTRTLTHCLLVLIATALCATPAWSDDGDDAAAAAPPSAKQEKPDGDEPARGRGAENEGGDAKVRANADDEAGDEGDPEGGREGDAGAKAPVKEDSPVGAFIALAKATARGDQAATAAGLHAEGARERELAAAMVKLAAAGAKVRAAVGKKFGDEGLKEWDRTVLPEGFEELLSHADVKVEGDRAEVRFGGAAEEPPMVMKRIGGRWKVAMSSALEQMKSRGQSAEDEIAKMGEQSTRMERVAGDVAAGKYASVAEVREAASIFRTETVEVREDVGGAEPPPPGGPRRE